MVLISEQKNGITNLHAYASGSYYVIQGQIYGFPIATSNFTVELTGYFNPPEKVNYEFHMEVDDDAMLTVGDGEAFACCNPSYSTNVGVSFAMFATWDSKNDVTGMSRTTQYMISGYLYPMKLVW
ncbi:hypothetical protein DASC09_039080 [Saccharomycopsis crataegensis]|uniref:PA14 domain-containing protein n=1 Tax=Saccharomycopsis crataegensis TaxID=43959 RepID=A0AAV5QR04_9ASCO|nr:hypothetical protein DASC09_039080 [Saccharomycopsis crataegensis]